MAYCRITGLDPAERAVLEAALAQHASSPESDGGSVRVAPADLESQSDMDASQVGPPNDAAALVAATAADGMDDVMEALCCPITHVRHVLAAACSPLRTSDLSTCPCMRMALIGSKQPGRILLQADLKHAVVVRAS